MNRPLASLLTILAILAGLAWYVLASGGEVIDDPVTATSSTPAATDADELSGLYLEDLPGDDLELSPSGLERSDLPGTNLEAMPDASFGEVRIQVVDAKYKRPVHGAMVWLLNRNLSDSSSMMQRLALAEGVESLLDGISERGRTNQDGIVVLPFFGGEVKIAALHGEYFTFTTRDLGEDDPVVVELLPALNVPVKVVNSDGDPVAGVPVSLRLVFGGSWRIDLLHTFTDEDGNAVLENMGIFKEDLDVSESLFVGLQIPLSKPVEEQIPMPKSKEELLAYAWPAGLEPLVLTMPDTGPVDVFLFDSDGEPFLEEAPVYLYLVDNLGNDPNRYDEQRSQAVRAAVTAVDGVAHFPWAELNKELYAECNFGGDTKISSATGPAVDSADQAARLELFQIQGRAMVRGQLVLADGTPVPAQTIEAVIRTDTPRGMNDPRQPVVIGEEGRFNFATSPLQAKEAMTATMVFQITHDHRLLFASTPLPLPLTSGGLDCGTLELGEAPLIVSGSITRPDGKPAVAQDLKVEVKLLNSADSRWREDRALRSGTHSDGRFRITGLPLDARYRLKINAYATLPVSEEFALGTTDLDIQLSAANRLHGRVVADDFLKSHDIKALARFGDVFANSQEDYYSFRKVSLNNFDFSIDGLPSSSVDIEFRLDQTNEVIDVVRGLMPEGREEVLHPHLDPVDLRGKVFRHEVRAVDTDGNPVQRFTVAWEGNGKESQVTSKNGVAHVVTTNPSLTALVLSRNHKTLRLEGLSGIAEVTLESPVVVRVVFEPPADIPDGYRLGVLMRPKSGPFYWERARTAFFNGNHRAGIRLGAPGRYLMTPYLEPTKGKKQKLWVESGGRWLDQTVNVTGKPGQTVQLSLSFSQMEETVRRFEEKNR